MDAEGAIWTGTPDYSVVRVAEGGELLQRVETRPRTGPALALMLGGPDRRTLFICTSSGGRKHDGTSPNSTG